MKKVIKLTESYLHNIVTNSVNKVLNEYGGYNSEKTAYGEQSLGNEFMTHLRRVGSKNGHTRTDAERKKGEERAQNNKKNLDKLRLRQTNNPYKDYLSNKKYADSIKDKDPNVASDFKKKSLEKLNKAVKESIKRVLKEEYENNIFIEDIYADELYRVDIHQVDDGNDIANAYFDDEDNAYEWAIEQVKDEELQADIYSCDNHYDDEYYDDIKEYLEWDANFSWYDTIGYVDGMMNQF